MEQKEIFELISRFENSSLNVLEIEQDSFKLHMEKGITAAPAPIAVTAQSPVLTPQSEKTPEALVGEDAASSPLDSVKSPIVGVYYASPSPDAPAYVRVGDKVAKGQVLCLVEAMKMMNELKAPKDGIIRAIHGVNGELVEYDQILFEVEPC